MFKGKKRVLVVALSLSVTSCATNNFGSINTATLIGCAGGLIVGGLAGRAIGDKEGAWIGAGIGALVGCSVGFLWSLREEQLAELAAQEKVNVDFERVGSDKNNQDNFVVVQSKAIKKAEARKDYDAINKVVGNDNIIGLSATVKGDIFSSGRSRITSQKHKRFFKKYAKMVKNSDSAILVIGHTDSTGSAQHNAKLSFERARSVANELMKDGIPSKDIYIYGAGESQPIASNLTRKGRAENRRIEIVSLENKPQYVSDFVRYKKSEPAYAKLRANDNLARQSGKTHQYLNTAPENKKEQIILKTATQHSNKRNKKSASFVDFKGSLYNGQGEDLFTYIGEQETNKYSLIGQAVAGKMDIASCVYDEPNVTTQIVGIDKADTNTSNYLPGMNYTAWWGKVQQHGIALSPVAVSNQSYTITAPPVVMIYKDYSPGHHNHPLKTHQQVDVNIYNGSDGVIYRVFIKDKKYPIKCIDLALNKRSIRHTFKAFVGKVYYQGPQGLMVADYKPEKA